jgi:protein-L-isoaspartate(D-aspartate) O-methyltransferase
MVERQLRARGINDERVLAAMAAIPRELFVPESQRRRAYADGALAIGYEQTISQPWIVAAISQGLGLAGDELLLEVGTGSGYSTAVLALLVREVISTERLPRLAERARATLEELAVGNAEVVVADGSEGLPERAPFDGIAVHATAPEPPAALLGQLRPGGRLVAPIAGRRADMLSVFVRREDKIDVAAGTGFQTIEIGPCRFVPLIGREGFPADSLDY